MKKQEADFIGSMNMCDEISNEAYKKIMCNCEVEESQPITSPSQYWAKQAENFGEIAMNEIDKARSCDDCISREALLNSLEEPMNWTDSEAEIQEQRDYENFVDLVKSMPSVTPSRPNGKWIPIKNKKGSIIAWRCNNCGNSPKHAIKSDFCPNCGADMRESEG